MYLHLELKVVPVELLTEAVDRLFDMHTLMSQNDGFVEAHMWRYLGAPGKYLIVRTWQSPEAHETYRETPEAKNFSAGRASPMPYKNLVVQHWNEVARSAGSSQGDFLVRSLHNVGAGSDDAYLAIRRQYDALTAIPGMPPASQVEVRTYRPLTGVDDLTEALVLERRTNRAGYDAFLESQISAGYEASLASTLYTTSIVEFYELVQQVLPK